MTLQSYTMIPEYVTGKMQGGSSFQCPTSSSPIRENPEVGKSALISTPLLLRFEQTSKSRTEEREGLKSTPLLALSFLILRTCSPLLCLRSLFSLSARTSACAPSVHLHSPLSALCSILTLHSLLSSRKC
ncbi:hypothetical protein E2C01_037863 [Portunus trituberculatus]|uniref:Uncharacterized protein n=1 Tax=Portunus trituberculatus TaxID=210409 RepID=A0A5B7FF88_PORTR|nr:hypothetical protein [Portunus trituberculatus]